jgi:uncharacterized DUF497 family protein
MAGIKFEWDERKNSSNKEKHGVSFEKAATVFADENALVIPDPEHSHSEDRFIILGLSATLRMLCVTAIERHPTSFASCPRANQRGRNNCNTNAGGTNEKGIRFLQGAPQPARQEAQTTGHNSARPPDN